MHIVYFYIRLYSFYGPCGPEIKLYYYYYYLTELIVLLWGVQVHVVKTQGLTL